MGSKGSGSLTDYPGSGKAAPDDRCNRAFRETLEDVEHCDYFESHGSGPPVGTDVHVALKKRVVAQTSSGQVIGNLPTSRNYVAACLKEGFSYVGKVTESSSGPPTAIVVVDLGAVPPK